MNITFNGCSYFDLTYLTTWERGIIAGTFGLIFLMIVSANSFTIYKIYLLKRKTRANLLFFALSTSDFFLGIFSVPTMILDIFRYEGLLIFKLDCKIYRYLSYTPTGITWSLAIFTALDRCFIILYDIKYESRVTKTRLLWILAFIVVFNLFTSAMISVSDNYSSTQIYGSAFSATVITLTVVAYIRLLWFVYYKQRQMKTNKSSKTKTINKLTRSIMYIFICQIGCNLPSTVLMAINRSSGSYEDRVIENKWNYWTKALVFSNSFFNSLILLPNGTFKKGNSKKNSGETVQTFPQIKKGNNDPSKNF